METDKLTEEQVHGRACRGCGSTEPPLHPDKALVTRVTTGVVRDTVTAVCTPCLAIGPNAHDRYQIERQPPVGELSGLYAIRDKTTGELVLNSAGDGPELFMLDFSAKHWIAERTAPEASRGR